MPDLPRLIQITTPLSTPLIVSGVSGREALSELFEYQVNVLSSDVQVHSADLLGKPANLKLALADNSAREFNGLITRVAHTGLGRRLYQYQLTMRPWLWLLTRTQDCKIFQNKTTPEIIQAVFEKHSSDFRLALNANYEPREYCVQYRESDFDFVSRLMEDEGIYYFFEHDGGKHTLVLTDHTGSHVAFGPTVPYRQTLNPMIEMEAITAWRPSDEVRTGKVLLSDFHFVEPPTSPGLKLQAEAAASPAGAHVGQWYDHELGMGPQGAGGSAASRRQTTRGRLARTRMEALQSLHTRVEGEGNVRTLVTGRRFTLKDFPAEAQNAEHIVVSTHIEMGHEGQEGDDAASAPYFNCRFTAIPSRAVFRPAQLTPRPRVSGPQTATVVGQAGSTNIDTDAHGRVKVQFHWDRDGQLDQNSSCWVRVSHPWAGQGWGMIALPRLGQEVVVEFLDGNPDLPLITGRVYNALQNPPYALPDHATVSTIKSRSAGQDDTTAFNELRFEDANGQEHVYLQAQRDFMRRVKNDSVHLVEHDEHVSITNDLRERIGQDRHVDIGRDLKQRVGGDLHLQSATDMLLASGGQYSLKADQDLTAEAGTSLSLKSGTALHVKAGTQLNIEAGVQITLKAGSSTVVIGPSGVSIVGSMVTINSGGGGSGASPLSPAAPQAPTAPLDLQDPLASS